MFTRWSIACGLLSLALTSYTPSPRAMQRDVGAAGSIAVRTAMVDGLKLQYLTAGRGPAVVLLHGYAETSRMWRPLIPRLAANFTVIAPDLPGIGGSDIPKDGLDMTRAGTRIHALVSELGIKNAAVVGHDIGLMVAYAYAAQFPAEVDKLVLMDAFLPGVPGWEPIYNDPAIWHFRFNGPTPEALVQGRERRYFDHFWNDFAADKTRSIPDPDRQAYTAAYARPGRMRAGWAYFVSFQQAAKDFARLSQTKLTMPVLSIGGEKANGAALGAQVKLVAGNASSVTLPNTGHWVMEERPQETTDALMGFLGERAAATAAASAPLEGGVRMLPALSSGRNALRLMSASIKGRTLVSRTNGGISVSSAGTDPRAAGAVAFGPQSSAAPKSSNLPQMRLTPAEVRANQTGSEQIGSSGLPGVSTKVVFGDPSKSGFYTVVLSVPAHTTIPAHSHRDDRMAVVVSGAWQFGYGDRFDEHVLKSLPAGSVYSEPGGLNHFARTGTEPVLVEISGYGPTDTRYVDPARAPKAPAQ